MRFLVTAAACAALGVCASDFARAQGPVREGLRRTGEIAVEGTRRVVEGTGQIARGVGEASAGTVRRTGEIAGNTLGVTPNTPIQAQGGANLAAIDQSRDARWRFNRHNGEWWYYTPQNTWMYHREGRWNEFAQDSFTPMNEGQLNQGPMMAGQQYSTGYRGLDQAQFNQNQQVRFDRNGRQFICDNGRAVYLDQMQGQSVQPPQQAQPAPAQPSGEHSVQRQSLSQGAQAPAQPIQQNAAPASSTPSAGFAAGGDVSRAPAGAEARTEAVGDPAAPREINNTPSPATYGAAEK